MSVGIAVLFVSAAFARERPAVPRLAVSEAPVPDVYVLADGTPVWVLPDPDAALVRIEVSMLEGHLHAADPAALQMAGALLGAAPAGGLARWNAQLDGAGGVAALGTGALRSWVDLEVLAGHEVEAVRLGRDAALRARFPWRDVRAVRDAWRETSATDWRSGSRVLDVATATATYPVGHPRARVDGPDVWEGLGPRRIRNAWRAAMAAPRAIVVVGNVDTAVLLPVLEETWAGPGGGRVAVTERPPPRGPMVVLVDHPGASQVLVRASLPAPGRLDPELASFEILTELLGGGFTSRLNHRLREELGITYGAGASLSLAATHGRLLMDTTVAPDDAALALDELNDALLMLELRPPEPSEVEAARLALRNREDRRAERLDGRVYPYGEALSLGRDPDAVATDRRAREAVGRDAVVAAAAAIASADDVVWLVVGDAELLIPALRERGWIPDALWSGHGLVEGRSVE